MVQHWFQPVLPESAGAQSKAMGKIKFLNFVQMELDKNRLKDSHCKLDAGMKVVLLFFCSGLGFSPFRSALPRNKGNVKGECWERDIFLFPASRLKNEGSWRF